MCLGVTGVWQVCVDEGRRQSWKVWSVEMTGVREGKGSCGRVEVRCVGETGLEAGVCVDEGRSQAWKVWEVFR